MSTTPQKTPEIPYASPATLVPSAARDFAVNAIFVVSMILMLLGLSVGGMGVLIMILPDGNRFGLMLAFTGACLFAAGVTNFVGGRRVRHDKHEWAAVLLILNLSLAAIFAAYLIWILYESIVTSNYSPFTIAFVSVPFLAAAVSSAALMRLCRKHTPG